jgi:hypothetical protein
VVCFFPNPKIAIVKSLSEGKVSCRVRRLPVREIYLDVRFNQQQPIAPWI